MSKAAGPAIPIRADASLSIGSSHVMRCRTLEPPGKFSCWLPWLVMPRLACWWRLSFLISAWVSTELASALALLVRRGAITLQESQEAWQRYGVLRAQRLQETCR